MAKGTLQIKYENLVLDNLDLKERIAELEADVKIKQSICEFTKMWRVTHDEPLTYNERIINSACDIIEKQDKRIIKLEAEIKPHT